MYINFACPSIPHLIVGGVSIFRKGDKHEKRSVHKAFDLIYVQKGCLHMTEDKTDFDIDPGQFLILAPDRVHLGSRHCEEDTVFYWVHFYTEGTYFYTDNHYLESPGKMNKNKYYQKESFTISLPQSGTVNRQYQELLRGYLEQIAQVKIDRYNQQKLFFDSISSQIDYQILFLRILSIVCESSEALNKRDLAEEIYEYLRGSYKTPFSLTELSHRFSFHPAYITRCLKRKYGMTPLQLLTRIRMDEAKKLLETTDLHVNMIGQTVGYQDPAYFSKQFKKAAGQTAAAYRVSHRSAPVR